MIDLNIDLGFKGVTIPLINDPVPVSVGGVKLPAGCIVSVTGQKNFVKTKVPGRDGTIKELIGRDDYTVSIAMVIQKPYYSMIEDELSKIITLWNKENSLIILCPKTEYYGIEKVVFEKISHPEIPGFPGTESLALEFAEDIDIELEVFDEL